MLLLPCWKIALAGDPRADAARTISLLQVATFEKVNVMEAIVRRLFVAGWRAGYQRQGGSLTEMSLFYAWAGGFHRKGSRVFTVGPSSGEDALSGSGLALVNIRLLSTQPVPMLYVQKDNAILSGEVTASSSTLEENQEEQLAQFAAQNMWRNEEALVRCGGARVDAGGQTQPCRTSFA